MNGESLILALFLESAVSLGVLTGASITPVVRGKDVEYQADFRVYQSGTDAVLNIIQ